MEIQRKAQRTSQVGFVINHRACGLCVHLCVCDLDLSLSLSVRKKSKFKSLKSRLFGRSKRAGGDAKLSQSASDITAGQGLGSDEDLV